MRFWIGFLVLLLCGISGTMTYDSSTTDTSPTYTTVTTESDTKATSETLSTVSKDSSTSGITSTRANTTITVVKPTGDSTVSGSTGNPASLQSTTPTEPTTQPFVVTTVTWPIPLSETDPTTLLQAIASLNYSVTSLKKDLTDLYNNLNLTGNNNYITQLQDLNNTIIQLQQNTTNLAADIDKANATYTATSLYAQPLIDTVSCFKSSLCAVAPTTTPWSPTPSPCPALLLNATDTPDTLYYTSSLKFKCQTSITSSNGNPIQLNVTATITDGTTLVVKNAIDNSVLKTFSKTDNDKSWINKTSVAAVRFEYSADDEEQNISLNAIYSTYDLCEGYCENNGKCTMQNGNPHCNCVDCYQGDQCKDKVDRTVMCGGNQVKRNCPTNIGTCETYYDGQTCTWVCDCNPEYEHNGNNQTCVAKSFEEGTQHKWLLW